IHSGARRRHAGDRGLALVFAERRRGGSLRSPHLDRGRQRVTGRNSDPSRRASKVAPCWRGRMVSPRTRGAAMSLSHKPITADRFGAVLFDLDGVLTATAKIHSSCWKTTFDDFLRHRAAEKGEAFRQFEIATDYKRYVDGKLRYDGVKS